MALEMLNEQRSSKYNQFMKQKTHGICLQFRVYELPFANEYGICKWGDVSHVTCLVGYCNCCRLCFVSFLFDVFLSFCFVLFYFIFFIKQNRLFLVAEGSWPTYAIRSLTLHNEMGAHFSFSFFLKSVKVGGALSHVVHDSSGPVCHRTENPKASSGDCETTPTIQLSGFKAPRILKSPKESQSIPKNRYMLANPAVGEAMT